MATDVIVVAGVIALLGLWWVGVVAKRRQTDREESDSRAGQPGESGRQRVDADDSVSRVTDRETNANHAVPGTWHPAGVEYRPADSGTSPRSPPAPGVCPACETENDPFYTYCRSCVHRLGQV